MRELDGRSQELDPLSSEQSKWNSEVCRSCAPVLQKYSSTFHGLKQQGSELKKRKHLHPQPKVPNREHYRDLVKQNLWIRNNIFDSMGNYLFCCNCVHMGLGISYQRLARQRKVKQSEHKNPIMKMKKTEAIDKDLGQYVVMPQDVDLSFIQWWKKT